MPGLQKQTLRLPITTGLAGKDAPLVQAPGSHLVLDDVRMERTGEWRRRHAWSHVSDDDITLPGGKDVVRAVELPGGGILALTEMSSDVNTCARLYSPTATTRWTIPPQFLPLFAGTQSAGSGQASLPLWSRHSTGYTNSPAPYTTFAVGNGVQFIAWTQDASPTTATAMFKTLAENESQGLPFTFGSTPTTVTAVRPRAVYFTGLPGTFLLLWIEGNNLYGQTWTGNGAPAVGPSLLVAGNVATGSGLDARMYPGSATATAVYQDTGGHLHLLEITSACTVSQSNTTTVSAAQVVQLLPEPDGSGVRYAAVSSANLQQVVRFNSTGTVLTTTNAGTRPTVTGFAGVAVNNGAGHVVVFQTPVGEIWASKAVTSPTSSVDRRITPAGTVVYIDSNGWREPGTDAMHWIAGIHMGLPGTPIVDFQHSYYEMALEYGGTTTVINQFCEPQARMIPLAAGPPAGCDLTGTIHPGAQVQVVRTGASAFSLPLLGLARVDTGGSAQIKNPVQYAIDRWDVLHLNATNMQGRNLGQGVKTASASYLPSGQLLQTVDGQQIVGHGASALPYQVQLSATTGGGLTTNCTYGYVLVVEMADEAGNTWRSTPSLPNEVALTGAQNAVQFTITLSPLESQLRVRTLKLYRTFANGSVYFLTWKQSGPAATNSFVTDIDIGQDAQLGTQLITALSEGDNGEQPATITPAFSHVVLFDGRLFGIDRDFPTRVWYSKPILQGASPEFPGSFNFDMPDELGPLTGMAACDDKLVLFKSPRGIYYVPHGGPANDGSGNQYMPVRLSSEVGLLSGQPYVSTGAEVYFGSEQGIYRINGSLGVDFVVTPIDQYLGQPLINTPDTLISATYNGAENEIRFLGLNAQYVFDRLHGLWVRDTFPQGNAPLLMRTIGAQDVVFFGGGAMWTEGTDANINDPTGANAAYIGRIRSAWYRPADMGGYLRLYGVRLLLDITESLGTQQQLLVYLNDLDTGAAVALSPVSVTRGEYEARTGALGKCGSFSLEMDLASSDIGVRLDAWTAIVGIKYGPRKLTPARRWQ